MTREIYLDHAATTPLDPRVREAMEPYGETIYGNPSSLYRQGRLAKDAVDHARETVQHIIGSRADDIVFTASGTEADNIAIFGVARMFPGKHLVTTAFEHHAGLRSFETLAREGWDVTYLPVG